MSCIERRMVYPLERFQRPAELLPVHQCNWRDEYPSNSPRAVLECYRAHVARHARAGGRIFVFGG